MDPALPAANEALFDQAHRALAAGRAAGAIAVARGAAGVRPDSHTATRLAGVLAAAGHPAEARAVLAPLAARDHGGPTAALAEIVWRDGALEEAVALLRLHLAACPGARHAHYWLASLLPHLGRFDEANRHAARGTLIPCGDGHFTSSRIIRFPEPPPAATATPVPPFVRRVRHEPPAEAAGAEAIYFVGCDSRYFLLFGEALANSLARRAGARLALHLHLVNPDLAAEELLQRLRATPSLPILCSREQVDRSAFGERQWRTYLSCARYLVLPELLDRYARPMLVADADQLVVGDLRGVLREVAAHDVGVLRNDWQIANILCLVSASILAVNATPGGRRFARTLCDAVVGRMADPVGLSWHLDQAGLAVAHLWHRDVRTLRLAPWIMDSVIDPMAAPDTLAPRALFWSVTLAHPHNAEKLRTDLFRQFLNSAPN